MNLILASNSPRRKQLLSEAGYKFNVIVSEFDEIGSTDPIKTAEDNAYGKALWVYERLGDDNAVVLGADTVVYYNDQLLGKPKDRKDAERMLKTLSGKSHYVVTGYAIISTRGKIKGHVKTRVTFNMLTEKDILEYLDSGLYADKAGGYGIQDGFGLVKEYDGSLSNVIGLPIEEIDKLLKNLNY